MKEVRYFCDRCGTEISKKPWSVKVRGIVRYLITTDDVKEKKYLCSRCERGLNSYLGGVDLAEAKEEL